MFLILYTYIFFGLSHNLYASYNKLPVYYIGNNSKIAGKDKLNEVISHLKQEYIKKLNNKEITEKAIKGLLNELDPHSDYLDEQSYKTFNEKSSGEFVGIGVEVTLEKGIIKIITPLDDSPAQKAGLKSGDYISHVDSKLATDLGFTEAINLIKGSENTYVTLTILRKNVQEPFDVKIQRKKIESSIVKKRFLTDSIGYIRISSFAETTYAATVDAIDYLFKNTKNLQGIVLDLRNNPGGLLSSSVDVTNMFLDSNLLKRNKKIVVARDRDKKITDEYRVHGKDLAKNIPIVVLINNGSASGAEILALALQDHKRAVIMGERSFGKGSIQSVIPIANNCAIKVTTGLYYSPSDRLIQGNGVIPDLKIEQLNLAKPLKNIEILESSLKNSLENDSSLSEDTNDNFVHKDFLDRLNVLHDSDFQVYQAVLFLDSMPGSKLDGGKGC